MTTYQTFMLILNIAAVLLSISMLVINMIKGQGWFAVMWTVVLIINALAVAIRISSIT